MRALAAVLLPALLCCARGAGPDPGLGAARSVGAARVALVIGNGAYQRSAVLRNPPADARAINAKLQALGFSTTLVIDEGRLGLERALRDFSRRLGGAEVALLFYAGHGLQVAGRNYLVPIDARLDSEVDVPYEALDLQRALEPLQTRARVGIVLLDACRDNPLANRLSRSVRSIGRGLERMDPASGELLIAYATSPGRTAADGQGEHSPFTQALLQHLGTPGLEVQGLLRRVISDVVAHTGGQQIPWQSASLRSDVFLVPAASGAAPKVVPAPREVPVSPVAPASPVAPPGMVAIPAGTFLMDYGRYARHVTPREHDHVGLPSARRVTLPAFFLDRTEVSVAEYLECQRQGACGVGGFDSSRLEANSDTEQRYCNAHNDRRKHPMNCVRFGDAAAYCAWARKRLPTAEEWEYAAFGGDGRRFPWGAGILGRGDACWQRELRRHEPDGDAGTCEVGSHPLDQGPTGALDLGGNLAEWTATRSGCCRSGPGGEDFSACTAGKEEYVIRGGGFIRWFYDAYPAETWWHLPAAPADQKGWGVVIGFRCARDR